MASRSLQRRILLWIGASLGLLMAVAIGIFSVQTNRSTRERVLGDVRALATLRATESRDFLQERGRVAQVVLTDPFLQAWARSYTRRGGDLAGYAPIMQRFKSLLDDPAMRSVFLASAATGEYFSETGRLSEVVKNGQATPYDARTRPWWGDTLSKGRLYVMPPTVDVKGAISAPMQMPVKTPEGTLLGVGGLDLSLQQLAELMRGVRYQGEGFAFLADENGNVITLKIGDTDIPMNTPIASLDGKLAGSRGFAGLLKDLPPEGVRVAQVQVGGAGQWAVVVPVRSEAPFVRWTLGLVIPSSVVDAPARKATLTAGFVGLGMLGLLLLATYVISLGIAKPLRQASGAMVDIAQGEGDLTRRLTATSRDELGTLAGAFNTFVARLQDLLGRAQTHVGTVLSSAGRVSDLGAQLHAEMEAERRDLDLQARAAGDFAGAFEDIQAHAAQATASANQAQGVTREGLSLAEGALGDIRATAESVRHASEALSGLMVQAEDIVKIVAVIEGFSNQTDLLALNAAIEAAHAGEHGRGFAVVAGEVRVLANRTAESVAQVQGIVERIQQGVGSVSASMQETRGRSEASVAKTEQMQEALAAIRQGVEEVQALNDRIAEATQRQREAVSDSHRRIQDLAGVADRVARVAGELEEDSARLREASGGLAEAVGQFRI